MIKDKISIIIPTKNEEKCIGDIIKECREYSDDIVVVDGHSEDATRVIATSLGARVYLDNKKGKGDALRLGIKKARKKFLVFIDADGSHNPKEIPALVKPLFDDACDHVSTSRMRGGSDELYGDLAKFVRVTGSNIITLGINYRFGVRLTDSQNGFRAIKKEVALNLNLQENITTIEQEMIIKTLINKYRLLEIPSHEYARKYGSSSINVKKVWLRYVYSWIKYLLT